MLLKAIRLATLATAALCAACVSGSLRLYEGAPRPAAEVATIGVPEALEVTAVNGREIRGASGLMRGGDLQMEVAPGRYELLVFYREIWERGGEHDTLKSDPVLFAFDAQAGHRYRLDYVRPQRYEDARDLSRQFKAWVEDTASGQRVESRPSGLEFRTGLVAELTGDDRLVQAAGASADAQAVAPMAAPRPQDGDWLLVMKGWWAQASATERREFLRWIGEQTPKAAD